MIQLPSPSYLGARLYWREYLLVQLPVFLLATYPLLYGLLPQLLQRRRAAIFLGGLLGWLAISALVSNAFWVFYGCVLTPIVFGEKPLVAFSWQHIGGEFFALLLVAGAASAIRVFNEWYAQQQLSQVLRQRQLRAELQLLKAQLQPTFLFSTLRSLHALTKQKSSDSPAAVLHLSALLRYMLYDGQLDAVPLSDEVDMMRHYVALEQLRLGRHVDVSLSFNGPLGQHHIAPLLLLPFVENAFAHITVAPADCQWVSIDLTVKVHSLTFKVISGRPEAEVATETALPETPVLASIRERLARLYPGRHKMRLVSEPDTLLASLHLQLAPADALPAVPARAARAELHFNSQP
ncbi:sensor histidine kinase [Hymenobacter rubidus]|uniref:sensor histidine kinase n=1 Tax=Hymenobacter rubidus TaxID=1441626 RepID=UPI00191F0378|nr:histidine kinase [Hymenobacter rubidus]